MPLFKRCRFCHQNVLSVLMKWHERRHARRLKDGQQQAHVTQPPDQRYSGSLEGVPTEYRHEKCQRITGMPEEIVRSYLVNPFLYNDTTFCCGCREYVPMSEVYWTQTDECVQDYMDLLRKAANECPITLTEAAMDALNEYAGEDKPRIRVSVSKLKEPTESGTYQYHLELDQRKPRKHDHVFEYESIQVLVGEDSLHFVRGTEIDFQTGPDGTGFRFDNPNAM